MKPRARAMPLLAAALALTAPAPAAMAAQAVAAERTADPRYDARRRAMVANIEQLAAAGAMAGVRRIDPKVLRVMREVPRHRFVPEAQRGRAYEDTPLPIGWDATISQPFIVAIMTHLLGVEPGQKVLEVGTGSGYQAAILSRLGAEVRTIEIVPQLARRAAATLSALGDGKVQVRAGDGYKGWPEQAPFDAILVTAGATHIPQPLVDQLKPGGRMLIPVGPKADRQQLVLVTKTAGGRVRQSRLGPVLFVPLDERARPNR